jgi:hypothetical protein
MKFQMGNFVMTYGQLILDLWLFKLSATGLVAFFLVPAVTAIMLAIAWRIASRPKQ